MIVQFHTGGGPFIMTAQSHTEFVDAFYRIAQDRANKIVILTGAGGGSSLLNRLLATVMAWPRCRKPSILFQ